jgi:hypothetical protein
MFGDGSLTFREFVMGESLPLAAIQDAVLEFLRGRTDAILFGTQAANAYVDEPRMTQAVDILSTRAADLAEDVRLFVSERFQIAVRVRIVANGLGHRVYQIRKPRNRHLVEVRSVDDLPPHRIIEDVPVISPADLVSMKVMSTVGRTATAKGIIDLADIYRPLLTFPELKAVEGPVADRLRTADASAAVLEAWREIVAWDIVAGDDDEY